MFAKLKECKSIKEIYEVLGREPFEKVAAVLLVLWSALPLPSIITHVMFSYVIKIPDHGYVYGIADNPVCSCVWPGTDIVG